MSSAVIDEKEIEEIPLEVAASIMGKVAAKARWRGTTPEERSKFATWVAQQRWNREKRDENASPGGITADQLLKKYPPIK